MTTKSLYKPGVMQAIKYQPCVSVLLPFEPKMTAKQELEGRLKRIAQQVKTALQEAYPAELADKVLLNLQQLFKKLDYSTYKKSVAFFVSPVFKKLYQLSIPVEEKVIVDASFEIRDLVYNKKVNRDFLLLVISSRHSRVFLVSNHHLQPVSRLFAEQRDVPERVPAFDEPAMIKLVEMEKFMQRVDKNLGVLINAYAVPLFVMGAKKTVGHFKKISHHLDKVVDFIYGFYEKETEEELLNIMTPFIADWELVKQKKLLQQLETAMGAHHLSIGMKDVWKEASRGRGQLLVVEKNYRCAAQYGKGPDDIMQEDVLATQNNLFIKDAVDDVMEKVLSGGGDVEFVQDGTLRDYAHIALVRYY